MPGLSPDEIHALAQKWFGDLGPQAVATMEGIVPAESGGQSVVSPVNTNGTYDRGIPQINDAWGFDPERLVNDPDYAMGAARYVYEHSGNSFEPWTTFTDGSYRQYMPAVDTTPTAPAQVVPTQAPSRQSATQPYAAQQGSTAVTQQATAPQTTVTGADIVKMIMDYLNAGVDQAQRQNGISGYYNPSSYPGMNTPTFAREQWQASQQNAERQYALDVQRFGLQVANQQFTQRLALADENLKALGLQTQLQGPKDWLRYNYVERGLQAPPDTTSQPFSATGAPAVSMGQSPEEQAHAAAMARATAMAAAINAGAMPNPSSVASGYVGAGQMGANGIRNDTGAGIQYGAGGAGGVAPGVATTQAARDSSNDRGFNGPGAGTGGGGGMGAPMAANTDPFASFREQYAAQLNAGLDPGSVPMLARGGSVTAPNVPQLSLGNAEPPLEGDVLPPGAADGFQPGHDDEMGSLIASILRHLYGSGASSAPPPQMAFGGRGQYQAVVGDPQKNGVPNRELVTSSGPFQVTPENQMSAAQRRLVEVGTKHAALGGDIDVASAPFMGVLNNGGSSFQGKSQPLGALGTSPFSGYNYSRLLPSEQQMLQGYVDTPTNQGGAGGFFADELAQAQRAAFTGARDFPYRTVASIGYGYS